MELQNYPNNSHKFKEQQKVAAEEERKKVEKVISGTAKTKKQSGLRKAMNDFLSDDVPNLKTYVVKDVVVPTIKKIISETVDMVLFGKSRSSSRIGDRVSYRKYYDEPRTRDASVNRSSYSYNEVILESRGEAERVLSQMSDMLDMYDMVSVADLYDLVGITGEYTDHKYGWTNIRNAEVIRCREGYLLQMPKALPIK